MVDLSALGDSSGGVWTRGQALTLIGREGVRAQLRAGAWQVLWPGTYGDAGFATSPEQRCWAAVLASSGAGQPVPFGEPHPETGRRRRRLRAVASHRTAARYWGLPLVDDDDPATGGEQHLFDDVSVWQHLPALHTGERTLRRTRQRLSGQDIVRTATGLYVTSVLRTATDLTALLSLPAAVCALDAALHQHLVTREQLDAAVTARRGTPGVRRLAAAVAAADARSESPHETLTRLLLLPVLPDLEPQVTLHDRQGRHVARFDLADRRRRLAVESDGVAGHAGPAMVWKDRRRDERAEGLGWWTERIGWYDVRRRPEQTAARVLRRAQLLDARRDEAA